MLKLGCNSLDEVSENVRAVCSMVNGEVMLDDTKLKTDQDVRNALDARDHEKSDHAATKSKLSAWHKFGKTPEQVQAVLDEYPTLKEGAKTSEDYLTEKKNHAATQRKLEELSTKFQEAEKKVNELNGYKTANIRSAKWKEIRERLGKKFDADKLDMLYEDIEDNLQIDEIGEFAPYKGKTVEEFFTNRAERMGWALKNTPGRSNPGAESIPKGVKQNDADTPEGGFLDDGEKALLDK